jgi:hypothetical protein
MAIRRCPYCKAIIDEGSEYCSNCGTQLLFPEDEHIEEDIPGEKIVYEDIPEEDLDPTEETKSSGREHSAGKRKKKDKGKTDKGITEEEIAAGMQELTELDERDEKKDEEEIPEDQEREKLEYIEEESEDYQVEKPVYEESSVEPDEVVSSGEDTEQPPKEEDEPEFKTEDLETIVDSEEKEKEEIEKFLKSLKEEREEWEGEIPPTDEFPPWAEKIKEDRPGEKAAVEEERDEEEEKVGLIEQEDEERPAEETFQSEDEVEIEDGEVEEILEEEKLEEEVLGEGIELKKEPAEEEVSMPDTGMGLPEGLEQESLPFETKPAEVYEEEQKSPPSRLSIWLKSRAFDVLFIAAIWIVTLHIASRMLSTNLFRLISVSALSVFGLYLVLLAVYLFLFFFFLGQTLGDHLFAQEE